MRNRNGNVLLFPIFSLFYICKICILCSPFLEAFDLLDDVRDLATVEVGAVVIAHEDVIQFLVV